MRNDVFFNYWLKKTSFLIYLPNTKKITITFNYNDFFYFCFFFFFFFLFFFLGAGGGGGGGGGACGGQAMQFVARNSHKGRTRFYFFKVAKTCVAACPSLKAFRTAFRGLLNSFLTKWFVGCSCFVIHYSFCMRLWTQFHVVYFSSKSAILLIAKRELYELYTFSPLNNNPFVTVYFEMLYFSSTSDYYYRWAIHWHNPFSSLLFFSLFFSFLNIFLTNYP